MWFNTTVASGDMRKLSYHYLSVSFLVDGDNEVRKAYKLWDVLVLGTSLCLRTGCQFQSEQSLPGSLVQEQPTATPFPVTLCACLLAHTPPELKLLKATDTCQNTLSPHISLFRPTASD